MDQAFSVPKCVRLARMSEKSYELLGKMIAALPERTKEELEPILGEKFMGYASGNFIDFDKDRSRKHFSTKNRNKLHWNYYKKIKTSTQSSDN